MKYLMIIVIMIISGCNQTTPIMPHAVIDDVLPDYRKSNRLDIYHITWHDEFTHHGTAFAIKNNNNIYIVTAAHVVRDTKYAQIQDQNFNLLTSAVVVGRNEELDVAVLKPDHTNGILPINVDLSNIIKTKVIGFPEDSKIPREISGYTSKMHMIGQLAIGGFSGSPVFVNDKVVGILTNSSRIIDNNGVAAPGFDGYSYTPITIAINLIK